MRHSDPSKLYGSVGAFVAAVLVCLVAFGVPLTEQQTVALLGVLAAAAPVLTAFGIRLHAWAPDSVDAAKADAWGEGMRYATDHLAPDPVQTDNRPRPEDGDDEVPQDPDWRP